ncbi:hypothetical protein GGE65_008266 [Skermanella aerolata]|uniref:hypothetical protein n=1 Tax=Skermanella aerolata TaxID=393310 RepID=UPI003D256AA7
MIAIQAVVKPQPAVVGVSKEGEHGTAVLQRIANAEWLSIIAHRAITFSLS